MPRRCFYIDRSGGRSDGRTVGRTVGGSDGRSSLSRPWGLISRILNYYITILRRAGEMKTHHGTSVGSKGIAGKEFLEELRHLPISLRE